MNGRTIGQIDGLMNGRTNGPINGLMNGRTNGPIDGLMNGRTNGPIDGLMNGPNGPNGRPRRLAEPEGRSHVGVRVGREAALGV